MRKIQMMTFIDISWIVVLVTVSSCSNSELFLEELNSAPTIGIIDSGSSQSHKVWSDSIKVSSEFGVFPYRFQLVVEDFNANIDEVRIVNTPESSDLSTGTLLFQYDTLLIDLEVIGVDQSSNLIDLEVIALGGDDLTLTFLSMDAFGESDEAILELAVFDNLLPIVNFEIQEESSGALIRRIDLSSSFDQDAPYGGAINSYHWVLGGTEFRLSQDHILHAFPSSGTFDVTVFVTDNNGSQSESKTFEVFIP